MVPVVLSDTFQSCVKSTLCIASLQMSLEEQSRQTTWGESWPVQKYPHTAGETPMGKRKANFSATQCSLDVFDCINPMACTVICPVHIEVYHMMQTWVYQVISPV